MRFNSNAGSLIPKILCVIAIVSLVAFFLLHRNGEAPRDTVSVSTKLPEPPSGQTYKPNQTTSDSDTRITDESSDNINSFPFSISKPIPAEDAEEEDFHFYNVNVPLEVGSIIDIYLKEPEGANLAFGVFNEDGELAYFDDIRAEGSEGFRFVITNEKPITIGIETISAPKTAQLGQYTLSVTYNPETKGHHIGSFPFTISKPFQEQDKVHLYQTTFPVDNGTIVRAELKVSDDTDLALCISDEKGALSCSKGKEEGKERVALTFFDGGIATVIVEVENKEGPSPAGVFYDLSVNTKGMERIIETLPYSASGNMTQTDADEKKWHWYQIASPVPAGTVISASLSVSERANMDITIFVDRDTISYGNVHGIGGNEHAELTIEKDSKVFVLIDNVEGEGDYSLTVTSTVPTKL